MDIQERVDLLIAENDALYDNGIWKCKLLMSPEAYVALRNHVFTEDGEILGDDYQGMPIILDTHMIGLRQIKIGTVGNMPPQPVIPGIT